MHRVIADRAAIYQQTTGRTPNVLLLGLSERALFQKFVDLPGVTVGGTSSIDPETGWVKQCMGMRILVVDKDEMAQPTFIPCIPGN